MQDEIAVLKEQIDLYFPPMKKELAKRLLDVLLKQSEIKGREVVYRSLLSGETSESISVPVAGTISKDGIEYSKGKD